MAISRRVMFAQMLVAGIVQALWRADASGETVEYSYDELGRLKTVTYSNGATITYTYDAAGNRTVLSQTAPTTPTADLTANPLTINQGASTSLTWATTNATSASINNGVGTVTPTSGGSVSASPSATTTYTLTATSPLGSANDPATVTVIPAPTLVATPATINLPGGSSSLGWTTSSATSASINNGVGSVSPLPAGSVSVSPSVTTTYTLTVNGPGGVATAQATVTPVFNPTIPITGTGPVNLRTLANAAGYSGNTNANITFQVGNGVTITGAAGAADNAGGIAIDSGTWPTGTHAITLALVVLNGGKVRAGGGGGGHGGEGGCPAQSGGVGGAGGDAIYCRLPMSVTINSGGEVRGGGGGGRGGGGGGDCDPFEPTSFGGGGGGGGKPNGAGGFGATDGGSNGGAGTATAVGQGGGSTNASPGLNGGDWASAGGGSGGAGGFAVRKNGHTVPVTNNGAMSGQAA